MKHQDFILPTILAVCLLLIPVAVAGAAPNAERADSPVRESLSGSWVRLGSNDAWITIAFGQDGKVTADFDSDGMIDVVTDYRNENGLLHLVDRSGMSCPGEGMYRLELTDLYLSLDMSSDECGGRIQIVAGFWAREDYETTLESLSRSIETLSDPELRLSRARMYLAIGDGLRARADLDVYLQNDEANARAFLNRAATGFPYRLESILADTDRAIALDPELKNAHFLRGLALNGLDRREEACKAFEIAIELGFTILRQAEANVCTSYWDR